MLPSLTLPVVRTVSAASLLLLAAAASAQSTPVSPETVEEILVTGRASAMYRVNELRSAKLPTEPLLSTQTIQVINEQLIRDLGARDAQDLYRNLSGVSFFSYAGVTARGFRQEENFYDGLRGDPYAGFSVPQLFNVSRLEFLKGPSGMLYGAGAPGGLFNYITKLPQQERMASLSAVLGNEGRRGVSGEASGGLTQRLSGRAGVFHESRDLPRDNADSEVDILDSGLRYDLDNGAVYLQATRYEQDLGGNRLRGVPTDNAGRFLADRRWNHNEASDFLRLHSDVLQLRTELDLSPALSFDAGLRWNKGEETQQYHEPNGLFDSDADGVIDATRRQFRDQYRDQEYLSFGSNLVWTHQRGSMDMRTLAGMDWYSNESDFDGFSLSGANTARPGLPAPLSLLNPVYGVTQPATYTLPPRSSYNRTQSEQDRAGAYLLNEVTWGQWIGVLGARVDTFEDKDLVSGAAFDDRATTWRTGLVYRLNDEVSLFGQWAQSFTPQSIGNQDPRRGGPFEPEQGSIVEAGVRTSLLNGGVQASAALFQIVRSDVLQTHPLGDANGDGLDDLIAFAEVTSEGVELDVTVDITPDWVATASYAYNDVLISKSANTNALSNSVGERFANAPRHQAGLWTRYQVQSLNTAFAIGADYVGERISLSGQEVPSYVVLDASIIYEKDDWRLLLRASNLLDRTYAASGFIDRTGHFPGAPRSFFAELVKQW